MISLACLLEPRFGKGTRVILVRHIINFLKVVQGPEELHTNAQTYQLILRNQTLHFAPLC